MPRNTFGALLNWILSYATISMRLPHGSFLVYGIGFKGTKDRKSVEELLGFAFECDLFYCANPNATARDVAKMQRLSKAVAEMLDAAS